MSAHLSPAKFSPGIRGLIPAAPHLKLALRLAWRRFRRAYAVALRDELARRTLRTLDDRMLEDIGISRAQAERQLTRSLWTLPYSA